MSETTDRTEGLLIRYAISDCSLGRLLVAATSRGLCAIFPGDEPQQLLRDLEARFPQATLAVGDDAFEQWVSQVVRFVDAPEKHGLALPLDQRGTAFQLRVWQALQSLAPGERVTYGELALQIGRPKAVRAVASACAANTLAVAIPCHRVVRRGGGLSGYRWGVERKRALLEREGLRPSA